MNWFHDILIAGAIGIIVVVIIATMVSCSGGGSYRGNV